MRYVTLGRMSLDAAAPPVLPRRARLSRKATVLLVVAALAAGAVGYLARYGLCESRSKFCVVEIVGTRSEVGFEWDSRAFYVSTHPSD
jgi:hypothetical protein